MIALQFRFLAGRYHATPWGRHVNEGDVDWPPEPWRLIRALIATWHHKVKSNGDHDPTVFTKLIESLAEQPPEYVVPQASLSNTRHYMPQQRKGKTSLVFDAFVALDRERPLVVLWRSLDLPSDQMDLLDVLLQSIGYLGRAESWVCASRLSSTFEFDSGNCKVNCKPGVKVINAETDELVGEVVRLRSPVSAREYSKRRSEFNRDAKQAKKLKTTLPTELLAAISLDTSDLQKQRWSEPPASQLISYVRPLDSLRPNRPDRILRTETYLVDQTTARFILLGKPLALVENTVRIGELLRMTVMSAFGRDESGNPLAPWYMSGHDIPAGSEHQHAFYLPYDSSGDGRLDRILVHVPAGLGDARRILSRFSRQRKHLRERNGGEWRLLLEAIGNTSVGSELATASKIWCSSTPYLHPWHRKKTLGIEDQIRKECRLRGLPEITCVKRCSTIPVGTRACRPLDFRRSRTYRSIPNQPDRLGSFWEIHFAEEVHGPLALGFACHFGLGLFKPK